MTADDVRAFVKDRLGSVKAPKQVEVWPDLPRSRVGKVQAARQGAEAGDQGAAERRRE